jgi:hypothetical protein
MASMNRRVSAVLAALIVLTAGFEFKYSRSGASLLSMLQPSTLETTLRLEPR